MQSIPFHIAFLLTRHDCVSVPGLGAFIIFQSEREKINRWGILSPPENFLRFNPEIKYNDGLLVNSIIIGKKSSYIEAKLMIAKYVTLVLHSLNEGRKVQIPWVGSLYLQDNKILFQPERILSCNAINYGLSGFSFPLCSLPPHQY